MAGTEVSVMKELKGILATDNVKNRFNEVLGKKAPQFMTSIINVVSQNNQLKESKKMDEMSTKFQLTADNYYSDEANREYLSVSQFKDFVGTYGRMGCEEMALAKIRGEYKTEPSNAMMIGSYVDSYYEGTLDEFRTKNPQIFRKDGKLLSGFQKAEDIIARTERDELFQKYMSGQKQVIMTAELFGVPWKIKMDSYLEGKAIVVTLIGTALWEQLVQSWD